MELDKLNYFKDKLIQEKKKIIKSKDNITNEEFGAMDMSYTESSGYDNHPADIATEVFMKEQDQGFKNKMDDKLAEIDISLDQIKEGSYGTCNKCNKKIDEERLELIPYLKTCLECSEEEKPALEFRQFESIDDSYATKFSNNPESNVIFDREDTYQSLASFNMVPGDPSFSGGDNIGIIDENEAGAVEEVENISQEYYDETLR